MKPRFLLVRSPLRKITRCDQSKLDAQSELKPITVSKRVLKNRISKDGIDHFLQLFGLKILAYRTSVKCNKGLGEMVTYHSFLNRLFFIPIQVLIALNTVFLIIGGIGILAGAIDFPDGEFDNFVGVTAAVAIIFWAFLFVMKFVGQFFARKSFRTIGDEVERWLSA